MIEHITALLNKCDTPETNFPPTDLYNEGWMLRLVLDWFSAHPGIDHDLAFTPTDRWYSEALLPSAFLARYVGDILAESRPHADGVIGDFVINTDQEGDLSLAEGASRILVTEAEMFGKLSHGTRNAKYFNQAARTVACIAELLCRAQIPPNKFNAIGFYVLAPATQIQDGVFGQYMSPGIMVDVVKQRVSEYQGPGKEKWLTDWFMPTLENIRIREIAWEEIINLIKELDQPFGVELETFYQKCLSFNQKPTNSNSNNRSHSLVL